MPRLKVLCSQTDWGCRSQEIAGCPGRRRPVYAVIKGTAVNNDGSARVSFTAPSVDGQADAIAMAQAIAGIDPATISYIEAHGTGTTLGDPVEIAGLTQAFRIGTDKTGFCAIGSVKTNIGHLDAAAGVTGLIKTTLALHHKVVACDSPLPVSESEAGAFTNTFRRERAAASMA